MGETCALLYLPFGLITGWARTSVAYQGAPMPGIAAAQGPAALDSRGTKQECTTTIHSNTGTR